MKISTLIVLIFSSLFVNGQCVPDTSITHGDPGTYPDVATNLPHSYVGSNYSTVIQVRVFVDSTFGIIHFVDDSIVITSVTGLPPGYSYSCTPSSCSFPGGGDGCVLLQGPAPNASMIGNYPLVVHTVAYGLANGSPASFPNDVSGYTIVIENPTAVQLTDKLSFSAAQNLPNPAKDFTFIPVTLVHPAAVTITISNLIGKKVLSHSLYLPKGKSNIPIDLHGFDPGIYLYTFTNGKDIVTRRMIISND